MKAFIIGLVLGIILVPVGVYLFVRSGRAPVATSAPPMPFERFLVRTAMHATIERQLPMAPQAAPTEAALVSGAQLFRQNCAVCHGLPGQPPSAIAKGMYPRPPQFFWPRTKPLDDPAAEIYWKAKNGIRLTGMPGFESSFTNEQLWQVSRFLANLAKLPPAALEALEPAPPSVPSKESSAAHRSRPRR